VIARDVDGRTKGSGFALMRQGFSFLGGMLAVAMLLTGCQPGPEVVVYAAHDRNLSESVLEAFTVETGIRVRALYDTEANKTTGLVNRLVAERSNPRADVFWNNEVGRTIQLKREGLLAPYRSREAEGRDPRYRDRDGYWTGFAARARVFIINSSEVTGDAWPRTLDDLADPRWRGRTAFANPHFGTTGTHFAALFTLWGEERFRDWLIRLRDNGAVLLPGNAQVRDKVAAGELAFGLTDTDDANGALLDGKPVVMGIPDQEAGDMGVFVIPNTVALIKDGPNPVEGKRLIDFLLSPAVEAMLAAGRGAQIPLRPGVQGPTNVPPLSEMKQLDVDYRELGAHFEAMLGVFRDTWPL
jgi:iron(III) transport system substrate-binding protein